MLISLLEHVGVFTDYFHPRTGEEISWWLELFIEEQDQLLQASSEWSQRTRSRTQGQGIKVICRLMIKDEDQRETICFEENTRVCVFILYSYRILCTIFAKCVKLNQTHKEKVFMEKAWYMISRSGTEISIPAVPIQEHENSSCLEFS